ncbi:hypothetical protein PILCRDRAFT_817972 [Piloderma croceum F 1598]|uniref:DUF7702 domain-containing protein n=1 Tax=Piloderma croceum (strain F 1598) TaxID=765440 RepID=A0A0C3FZF5_PILCF|nr:hypothetical protein PILCRDRAFT_817972 [Piloderma croceum F 1598]
MARLIDKHGKVAVGIISFYCTLLGIVLKLVLRHGFRREAGWIFLFIFCIIRILGGSLQEASATTLPINTGLFIATAVLTSAGLSPLLIATLAFVQTVAKTAFGENPLLTRGFRLLGLIAIVGFILSLVGGINGTSTNPSEINQAKTLRHVGSILFALVYGFLVAVHIGCWLCARRLTKARRTLLIAISSALPFLGVRVVYSVLSAYSGSPISTPTSSTTGSLSKFNIVNGEWQIYLVMGLVMEYIVVLVYVIAGILIPRQEVDDFPSQKGPKELQAAHPEQGYSA